MRSEGPLLGPYQAFLRFLLCLSWVQLMGCSCHVAFRAPLRSRFCCPSLITCPTICEAQAAEKWGTLAAGESPTVWTGHPGWRVMGFFSFRGSNTLPGNRGCGGKNCAPKKVWASQRWQGQSMKSSKSNTNKNKNVFKHVLCDRDDFWCSDKFLESSLLYEIAVTFIWFYRSGL